MQKTKPGYPEEKFYAPKNIKVLFCVGTVLISFLIIFLFYHLDYVENEGFNPSDDGVILAQSYRLINGEIPHKDFISIRPVFSGIFHTLHFFIPVPLEISARWSVVMQYLLLSFLWVYMLGKVFLFFRGKAAQSIFIFLTAGIFTFFSGLGNYNIFPWTTIDALFFTTLGLFFFYHCFGDNKSKIHFFSAVTGIFFFSIAALCRQSFVLVVVIAIVLLFLKGIRLRKKTLSLFSIILGSSPLLFYASYLLYHDAMPLFIQQMTGRTEFVQTGIVRFVYQFFTAKLFIINAATLLIFLYFFIKSKAWLYNTLRFIHLTEKQRKFTSGIIFFYICASIVFTFYFFLQKEQNIFNIPFELFWITLVLTFITFMTLPLHPQQKILILSGIVIAWISSISLGDNSPIFVVGNLAVQNLLIGFYTMLRISPKSDSIVYKFQTSFFFRIVVVFALSGFIVSCIYSQRKFNYRDLESSKLEACLCAVSEEFGTIRTNKNTFEYYSELTNIFARFPGMENSFVSIPNNAIVYPLLDSKNPFPLDWMQPDEYVGSENILYQKIDSVLNKKNIYVLVDIYDSKKMAFMLVNKDYSDYKYLKHIDKRLIEIPLNEKHFKLYKTN